MVELSAQLFEKLQLEAATIKHLQVQLLFGRLLHFCLACFLVETSRYKGKYHWEQSGRPPSWLTTRAPVVRIAGSMHRKPVTVNEGMND